MKSSPLHELYDVSILFDAVAPARSAWTQVARTDATECTVSEGTLHGLGWFHAEQMPRDILDTRLVEPSFTTGAAYVSLKLGVMDQFEIRRMLTNPETGQSPYPDPWAENALQRTASNLVQRLLDLGGKAVVLHKAAAAVKSADQFREELGDPSDEDRRSYLAWLDTIASEDGDGGVMCRSYGMVHYFGAPNVRASAPRADRRSIECSMQAVLQACQRIAGNNESPFNLKTLALPAFRVADSSFPPIEWTATYLEDEALIDLTTAALGARSKRGVFGRLKRLLRTDVT
jgi:hypothetical protein